MKVTRISGGPLPTNCYLLQDEVTGGCAVIDPGFESETLDRALLSAGPENVKLILLTHGHFDHIMGVDSVKKLTGAKVCAFADETLLINDDSLNLSSMMAAPVKAFSVDSLLNDGDVIPLGSLEIHVLHTPGHTIGGCCYFAGNAIFTGDTLMKCTCGRTDFPTGSYPQMMESLQKLKNLEGDYHIYPGHEGESTMEYERKNNPYMGSKTDDFNY